MKSFKKISIILLLITAFFSSSYQTKAQVPEKIMVSLKTGNAKVLSGYFNKNIELVILENDNVYSKPQAEQIVANFFKVHKPSSFKVIHQGGKEDAKYVIGKLETNKGDFRIYFLLKGTSEDVLIHQLRIEKQ